MEYKCIRRWYLSIIDTGRCEATSEGGDSLFCTYWLFSRMATTLNFVSLKHASLFLYLLYQPFFVPTFLSYFFFVPTCTSHFLYLLAVQPYGGDFKLCKFKTRQPFFVPTCTSLFFTYWLFSHMARILNFKRQGNSPTFSSKPCTTPTLQPFFVPTGWLHFFSWIPSPYLFPPCVFNSPRLFMPLWSYRYFWFLYKGFDISEENTIFLKYKKKFFL